MARKRKRRWLAAASLAGLAWLAWAWWVPAGGFRPPRLVRIAPQASTIQIAGQLRRAGVVRSAIAFLLWRMWHPNAVLQAGTYRFQAPRSLAQVFEKLERGQVFVYNFTVPEGFNRFDIAHGLQAAGLASAASFLRATASGAPIEDLDPQAPNLEGYLYPATYPIPPQTPARAIARMMVARFRAMLGRHGWKPAQLRRLWRPDPPGPRPQGGKPRALPPPGPDSLHAWVTIASLVEKETARARERPLIAGVFYNRLSRGLPLQCDPTVIYAAELAHRYHGTITRRDLRLESPYNTYLKAGLPPGPIANPGVAALRAALHPGLTPYLYFVSNGHGGHRFARTLARQDMNVKKYLRAIAPRR